MKNFSVHPIRVEHPDVEQWPFQLGKLGR